MASETGTSVRAKPSKEMPSGRVAFYFEDRDQFIRCLEEVSRYEGRMCQVAPFHMIIMDTLMGKVCQKRGIVPARVWTKVKASGDMPEDEVARVMQQSKEMLKDVGILPRDA